MLASSVYAFYELLPLLGDRRSGTTLPSPGSDAFFPYTDLLHLATMADSHIGVLFTCCPERGGGPGWSLEYTLGGLRWPRINAAWFRVDSAHAYAFAAAGHRMPTVLDGPAAVRKVRMAQELGVAAPIQSGLALSGGVFRDQLSLAPFATALLWITPFSPAAPAVPEWVAAEASGGNVVLRWRPSREAAFYTYEVFRLDPGGQVGPRLSPLPLRSALWVDTAPPRGAHVSGVRTVSASGVASAVVPGPSVRV